MDTTPKRIWTPPLYAYGHHPICAFKVYARQRGQPPQACCAAIPGHPRHAVLPSRAILGMLCGHPSHPAVLRAAG
eukprot:122016-Chlamydomonas_euryale.AAC.1